MNRTVLYVLSLIGFFMVWGFFGVVAARTYREPVLPASLAPAQREMNSEAADPAIPVTGQPRSAGSFDLYVALLSLGMLVAILALWNAAHQPITNDVRLKDPPHES
jgi:hypothetical protein